MIAEEYKNIYQYENFYWWYLILDELVEHFVALKSGNSKIKFLEAGCGTGRILKKFSKYGEGFGIDSSPIAIDLCKSRGLKNISLADLNSWKPESKFNLIISLDVLYHQSIKNFEQILDTFYNALYNHGSLILNLPAFSCLKREHDQVVGGNRRFRKSELKNALQKKGFLVEILTYRYPILFVFILLSKIFSSRSSKGSDLTPIHPFLNNLLYLFHKIENTLIKMGISIPFGSSVFVLAHKVSDSPAINSDYPSISSKKDLTPAFFTQLFKYSFVGVFNTLIGLSVIYILYNFFHFGYVFANIGGHAAGLLNSFIWNKRWTFQSSKHFSTEIIPFITVFGISYFINLVVVIFSVEFLKINPNYSQVLGIAAYSLTNFLVNRKWTFSKQ